MSQRPNSSNAQAFYSRATSRGEQDKEVTACPFRLPLCIMLINT
jgi:hypothetical protein